MNLWSNSQWLSCIVGNLGADVSCESDNFRRSDEVVLILIYGGNNKQYGTFNKYDNKTKKENKNMVQ